MGGSKQGAQKAMESIRMKHGEDFHARIGSIGGKAKGIRKGFTSESARKWGAIGGKLSTRKGVKSQKTGIL